MDIQERKEKAKSGKEKEYTCSQCVISAVADLLDADEVTLLKISHCFGGGIGGLEEVCGVVSAMTMAAGLVCSNADLEGNPSKMEVVEIAKELALEFRERNKTIICREIRGTISGKPMADCDECILDGVEILMDKLFCDRTN